MEVNIDKRANPAFFGHSDEQPAGGAAGDPLPLRFQFLLDHEDEDDPPSPGGFGAASQSEGKTRKRKKPWRYLWPDEVRDEILARLLKLNAERAAAERLAGLAPGKTGGRGDVATGRKRVAKSPSAQRDMSG